MSILPIGSSQWVIRDTIINMQNCLQSTQKIKIYRGFKKSTSNDMILKIITVNLNLLKKYELIIKNATQFYRRQKRTEDFILSTQHVQAYQSTSKIPKAQKPQDQQCHLYIIRPYFAGSNFHQAVYINQKLPYQQQQFYIFIKQTINLISQIHYTQGLRPTFLPTLQNIYIDKMNLNANLLSVQSIMFLKHKMAHISIQNFKHLYPLLKSNPQIFVNWQKMQQYMSQQMLCRSILILWICFMTLRSPIQIVWQTKLNDQQLEWNHLIFNQNTENNKPQIKINQNNKIISLIRNAPKLWFTFLNKPQNIKCFQLFSQIMFQTIKHLLPKSNYYIKNKQQQKHYFYQLFQKVFIKQQKFGWKQLFSSQEIFLYIKEMSTDQQVRKKQETIKKGIKEQILKQIKKRMQIKVDLMKQSFIQVHKYFLYKDIKQLRLSRQQAKQYAKKLNFNTYVPFKIGLSIQNTLSYKNWFEIFFTQNHESRPFVYDSANYLFDMLQKQCGQMLQHIKSSQFYHIKRVLYLLGMKIAQNKQIKQTFRQLNKQIDQFVYKRRKYQYSLKSLAKQLKIVASSQKDKPLLKQLIQHCKKKMQQNQYDDLAVFYAVYIHMEEQTTAHTMSSSQIDKLWKTLQPIFKDKVQKAFKQDLRLKQEQKKLQKQDCQNVKYQQVHFKDKIVKQLSDLLEIKL